MKKFIIPMLLLGIASCTKVAQEEIAPNGEYMSTMCGYNLPTNPPVTYTSCGTETTVNLIAGKNSIAGTVKIGNDGTDAYITYTTTGDWKISETHLYVGDCNSIPKNNAGNPKVGNFPIAKNHSKYTTTYTAVVPLANLPACMCVAAHAVVKRKYCGKYQTETAWGDGTKFTGGNWAMYFNYCKQNCDGPPPPIN